MKQKHVDPISHHWSHFCWRQRGSSL